MGLLTQSDSIIYRNFFKEMAYLRGITVDYQYPVAENMSIYGQLKTKLSQPKKMDIIFDANPKINTLKRIGWVSENPEDKPYIAQLPFDAENLKVGCVITISPSIEIGTNHRRFKVTTINTLLEFPDCWTCTLAPIFNSDIPKGSYEDSNYNYIDTDDTPDSDTPDNKVGGQYFNI